MRTSGRFALAVVLILVLAGFAVLASRLYQERNERGQPAPARNEEVSVTSAADRGPGSLREALFVAAASKGKLNVVIRVPTITLETALPPLASPRGISISAKDPGVVIDAQAIHDAPVFDIAGASTSISGVTIRNCAGAAVLVRASLFHLASSTIESCDVGVDVAENANDLSLTRNRFAKNRVGLRFAATSTNTSVTGNQFTGQSDAGIWAVRSPADLRNPPIAVHDNKFSGDRLGVLAGNLAMQLESNELLDARETAIHVIGTGVTVRRNRISGAAAMGIIAENTRGVTIESNEIDRVTAYAIMARGSADTLVRDNRIHNCGYGIAFVLGDASSPSTAADNSIIEPRFNGIDVIGDSPVLRHNQVINPRALALHVQDFEQPNGKTVRAGPFLDDNNFGTDKARIVAGRAVQRTP
jgi:parallel beta-helix repeat protein